MNVTSSAYATTLGVRLPAVRLFSCSVVSSMQRSGFMHMVNSSMLIGHPCLMPLRISIGSDKCPLTCMEETAFIYIFFNRVKKFGLNPQCSSVPVFQCSSVPVP